MFATVRSWLRDTFLARESEVADEMLFHFRSLVEDGVNSGQSFAQAWDNAEARFGSLRHYVAACQAAARRRQLLGMAAVACALVGFGVLIINRSERRAVAQGRTNELVLRAAHTAALASASKASPRAKKWQDAAGKIVDAQQQPLAEAKLLVIRKTWPSGRYRQEPFSTATDEQGRFRFAKLLPDGARYGLQLAAFKDGYAFKSVYQLSDEPVVDVDKIDLALAKSTPVRLVIQDAGGNPLAKADVIPSSRKSTGGDEHLIYFTGAEELAKQADDKGQLELNCFAGGDQAQIYVRPAGGDWQEERIAVPAQGGDVVVKLPAEGKK